MPKQKQREPGLTAEELRVLRLALTGEQRVLESCLVGEIHIFNLAALQQGLLDALSPKNRPLTVEKINAAAKHRFGLIMQTARKQAAEKETAAPETPKPEGPTP